MPQKGAQPQPLQKQCFLNMGSSVNCFQLFLSFNINVAFKKKNHHENLYE